MVISQGSLFSPRIGVSTGITGVSPQPDRQGLDKRIAHLNVHRLEPFQWRGWVDATGLMTRVLEAFELFVSGLPFERRQWFEAHYDPTVPLPSKRGSPGTLHTKTN